MMIAQTHSHTHTSITFQYLTIYCTTTENRTNLIPFSVVQHYVGALGTGGLEVAWRCDCDDEARRRDGGTAPLSDRLGVRIERGA